MNNRFENIDDAANSNYAIIEKVFSRPGVSVEEPANKFSAFDGTVSYRGEDGILRILLVESKVRRFTYDVLKHTYGGKLFFERKKWERLMKSVERASDENRIVKALYLNETSDGRVIIFDVTDGGAIQWETRKMNEQTYDDARGYAVKVDKQVALLDISDAIYDSSRQFGI